MNRECIHSKFILNEANNKKLLVQCFVSFCSLFSLLWSYARREIERDALKHGRDTLHTQCAQSVHNDNSVLVNNLAFSEYYCLSLICTVTAVFSLSFRVSFHSCFSSALVLSTFIFRLFSGYGRAKAMHKTFIPDTHFDRTNTCHKIGFL